MTNEEAIQILENYGGLFPQANGEAESIDLAIEALEKQIAKKPKYQPYFHSCPCCKSEMIIDREYGTQWDYCPDCGQKLDWSDCE